ncbi:hypothetical protein MTF65_03835 [Streptomyces sp. APSN-46.1]|uniref:protealysin inhibitor emfourin n=1 Tax=Streptomyces sp. APSN-46.1 TaxID=2929049 RepID=UPI001FB378AF|nr:protealysin inhibitor emfourin [Streptomyces sp. APSN-46.1]MCJ1676494.1 hypothetical protein [Streptomyces sp. APSN-46.1]
MRIRVIRSGGLLGMTRRAELETSGRPDAAELERLAREVLADTPPGPAAGVPDGYQYTVTVDDDRTVEFSEPGLSDAQSQLVERVLGEGA